MVCIGTYDTGVGSLASHPYQYETTSLNNFGDHPQPQMNNFSNTQTRLNNDRSMPMDAMQTSQKKNVDSKTYQQVHMNHKK